MKCYDPTPKPVPENIFFDALAEADKRTRLMIALGGFMGLRCCEIAKIHSKDYDGKGLTIKGKGGKIRYLPVVNGEIKRALEECNGYLFPSINAPFLTAGHIGKLIKQYLPKEYSAHCLRHRFATQAYNKTSNLLAVSKALGHSNPTTTKRYVDLCNKTMIELMNSVLFS